MPGVVRPYTLADVIGTINAQQNQQDEMINLVGSFAEADETAPASDSAFGTAAVPTAWDAGVWGATQWS